MSLDEQISENSFSVSSTDSFVTAVCTLPPAINVDTSFPHET